MLENKQEPRSCFNGFLFHILNPLMTKLVQSRWLDVGQVLFLRIRPIAIHHDRTSLVNKRFIIWHKEHWKNYFCSCLFLNIKRKPVICKSDGTFQFSHFLVQSRQRNHKKSFCCHGKYFAKENFHAPAWTWAKYYCRNKMSMNPEWALSLYLSHLGSQS